MTIARGQARRTIECARASFRVISAPFRLSLFALLVYIATHAVCAPHLRAGKSRAKDYLESLAERVRDCAAAAARDDIFFVEEGDFIHERAVERGSAAGG